MKEEEPRKCRICGCVDGDCRRCAEKTGVPCHWVEDDLCSACKTIVIALASIKGGTGKTHAAILLARCLAASGKRVLLIDFDLNNSLSYYFLLLLTEIMEKTRKLNIAAALGDEKNNLCDFIVPTSVQGVDLINGKGAAFRPLLDGRAPLEPAPQLRKNRQPSAAPAAREAQGPKDALCATENAAAGDAAYAAGAAQGKAAGNAELLEALGSLPGRKKNDGSGRAAAAVAARFSISQAAVYQARKVLKLGSTELIWALRQGLPIKTAYKRLAKELSLRQPVIEPVSDAG